MKDVFYKPIRQKKTFAEVKMSDDCKQVWERNKVKSKISVRKYNAGDCAALAELFYETVRSVNAKDYSQKQLCAWAPEETDLKQWDKSFRGSFTAVAEYGGVTAGFGNIDESGYLDMLYVHKDYQGLGIASAICDTIEKYPKHPYADKIYTYASITAKPFFESRGYHVVRENAAEKCGIYLTNYLMEKTVYESAAAFTDSENKTVKPAAAFAESENKLSKPSEDCKECGFALADTEKERFKLIRAFTAADMKHVAEIWLEANEQAHCFIPPKYWESKLQAVEELIPEAEVYVYDEGIKDGEAAEFAVCGFIGLNGGYIEGLFVPELYRGKGIGRALLDFVKEKKAELNLKVYKKNLKAISFYRREGFIVCGSGADVETGEEEFYMEWIKEDV